MKIIIDLIYNILGALGCLIAFFSFIYGIFYMAAWGWYDGKGKQVTDINIK